MKNVSLIGTLALSLGFALACGGGEKAPEAPPPPAQAPAAAPVAATGGSIGVKECDDYIAKMESCLGGMDATAKAAYEASFKQTKDAWVQAASTEAGKAGLAQACAAAANAMPANCGAGGTTAATTTATTTTTTGGGTTSATVTAGGTTVTATSGAGGASAAVTTGGTTTTAETKPAVEQGKKAPPKDAKAPSLESVRGSAAPSSGGASKSGGSSGGSSGGASKH